MVEKTKQQEIEESKGLINDANNAAEKLERAYKDYKDLVERQEAISARMMLGGRSELTPKEEPKPETPKEYKDRIMRGFSQ